MFIEATRYKQREKYHYVLEPYVKDIREVWLSDYMLAVSKGYPGLVYKPNAPLIKVELFDIEKEYIEEYKECITNRHITWETIPEVYDVNTGDIINNVVAPVLKPLTTIFSYNTPIYHLAPQLKVWTEHKNNQVLAELESAIRNTRVDFYPTAMEI